MDVDKRSGLYNDGKKQEDAGMVTSYGRELMLGIFYAYKLSFEKGFLQAKGIDIEGGKDTSTQVMITICSKS